MAEKYIMIDLNDEKSKDIATVLNSSASKKILNLLSEKTKLSESDIAKTLSLPISTVHYNLSVLVKAKLVEVKEYHYSSKGREVNHYSLANKFIIIAPSKIDESTKNKLKNLFMSILFGTIFIGTATFSFLQKSVSYFGATTNVLQESTRSVAYAPDVIITSGNSVSSGVSVAKMAPEAVPFTASVSFWSFSNPYMWLILGIIIGVAFILFIVYLVKFIKAKRISS